MSDPDDKPLTFEQRLKKAAANRAGYERKRQARLRAAERERLGLRPWQRRNEARPD